MPVQEFTWGDVHDEHWAAKVTLRMLWHHNAPVEAVDAAVGQAHQACADSGRSAQELFGPSYAYAAEAVREFAPTAQRAAADLDGGAGLLDYDAVLFGVCGTGLAGCARLVASGRSTVTVTPAALAVAFALLGAGTVSVAARRARFNGHLTRAAVLSGLTGGVLVAAGAARDLPVADRPLAQLPVPLLAAASLAAGVVGWQLPIPAHADRDIPVGADEWFSRLYGLLRGRWYLSRVQALHLTEEARNHWQLSGTGHPREEFGAPPVHALHLAEGTRDSRTGRARVQAWALFPLAVAAGERPRRRLAARSGGEDGLPSIGRQLVGAAAVASPAFCYAWDAATEWRTSYRVRRPRA